MVLKKVMTNLLKRMRLIKRMGQLCFIGFICLVSLSIFSYSFAQIPPEGRLDVTVSPPVIELVAKPGDKILERFRVRNNTDTKVDLQISVRRLISDPTNGNPIPEVVAKGEELSWVSFDQSSFEARPLEWENITFTINIPKSAAYGYYYVFRIAPKDNKSAITTGATVKGEILIVTLLNVLKDGAISDTKLVSFRPKNYISEYLPVDFAVILENRGNVHVKPRGNIFITRGTGNEMGILEVNPGIGSILPGGTREFISSWNEGFLIREPVIEEGATKLDGNGKPVTKLLVNWNKLTTFRVGPYTARLLMVYDDGSKDVVIEGSTRFWVIPYTAIGIILATLTILFIFIRFLLKWYIRRAIQKSRSK